MSSILSERIALLSEPLEIAFALEEYPNLYGFALYFILLSVARLPRDCLEYVNR
jgi:hypothetical protein